MCAKVRLNSRIIGWGDIQRPSLVLAHDLAIANHYLAVLEHQVGPGEIIDFLCVSRDSLDTCPFVDTRMYPAARFVAIVFEFSIQESCLPTRYSLLGVCLRTMLSCLLMSDLIASEQILGFCQT